MTRREDPRSARTSAAEARLGERSQERARAEGLALHLDAACLVCGAPVPEEPIGAVREHEYEETTGVEFPVVECPACGLVYLAPRPAESELERIYPDRYYAHRLATRSASAAERAPSFVERALEARSARVLGERLRALGIVAGGARPPRVLDVGCGTGRHLDLVRRALPGAETHGVDLSEAAVEVARRKGHVGHAGRFEDVALPPGGFDLVLSFHVVEHVARPDRFLARCAEALRPGGRILIETPSTDGVDFRLLRRRHWGGYHAPRHWYLFRPSTLERLAPRVGLRMTSFGPAANAPFWVWTCHSLARPVLGRRLAGALFPPVEIFYGGVYSLALLAGFSLFERLLIRATGRGSSLWAVFAKDDGRSG